MMLDNRAQSTPAIHVLPLVLLEAQRLNGYCRGAEEFGHALGTTFPSHCDMFPFKLVIFELVSLPESS
jgi:hypothetical protein